MRAWTKPTWVLPLPTEINLIIDEYIPNKWLQLIQGLERNHHRREIMKIKAYKFIARLRMRMLRDAYE